MKEIVSPHVASLKQTLAIILIELVEQRVVLLLFFERFGSFAEIYRGHSSLPVDYGSVVESCSGSEANLPVSKPAISKAGRAPGRAREARISYRRAVVNSGRKPSDLKSERETLTARNSSTFFLRG